MTVYFVLSISPSLGQIILLSNMSITKVIRVPKLLISNRLCILLMTVLHYVAKQCKKEAFFHISYH